MINTSEKLQASQAFLGVATRAQILKNSSENLVTIITQTQSLYWDLDDDDDYRAFIKLVAKDFHGFVKTNDLLLNTMNNIPEFELGLLTDKKISTVKEFKVIFEELEELLIAISVDVYGDLNEYLLEAQYLLEKGEPGEVDISGVEYVNSVLSSCERIEVQLSELIAEGESQLTEAFEIDAVEV